VVYQLYRIEYNLYHPHKPDQAIPAPKSDIQPAFEKPSFFLNWRLIGKQSSLRMIPCMLSTIRG